MKKILTALLAGIILVLSGCSLVFPDSGTSSDDKSSKTSSSGDYLHEYENAWCYQRLEPRLKKDYQDIYAAVRERFGRDENVTITDSENGTQHDYTGLRVELSQPLYNRDEAQMLYTAFTCDNPQFFYIGNTYSYEGYRSENTNYYNVFCLVFTMSAQERAVASSQLEQAASSLLKDVKSKEVSQFETELIIHDKLASVCTYETRASDIDDPAEMYPTAFTAYGALVEGRAVCEGYSRAMQLLLHRVGMECTLVSGADKNGISHMWNLVTTDGYNYHLDLTWDDTGDRLHHSFFNLTTKEVLLTHTLDPENIGVDTCTAVDANYYRRFGRYINIAKRDEIAKVIAEAVRNGETMIDLRFTKSTFASAHLFVNNITLLTEKVNAQLKGSGLKMWDYKDYNINETYYTITLYNTALINDSE